MAIKQLRNRASKNANFQRFHELKCKTSCSFRFFSFCKYLNTLITLSLYLPTKFLKIISMSRIFLIWKMLHIAVGIRNSCCIIRANTQGNHCWLLFQDLRVVQLICLQKDFIQSGLPFVNIYKAIWRVLLHMSWWWLLTICCFFKDAQPPGVTAVVYTNKQPIIIFSWMIFSLSDRGTNNNLSPDS